MAKDFEEKNEKVQAIPRVIYSGNHMLVPKGYEEHYASFWKWCVLMGIIVDDAKKRYIIRFEAKHGTITHQKGRNGTLRALPKPKDSMDLGIYNKKQEI